MLNVSQGQNISSKIPMLTPLSEQTQNYFNTLVQLPHICAYIAGHKSDYRAAWDIHTHDTGRIMSYYSCYYVMTTVDFYPLCSEFLQSRLSSRSLPTKSGPVGRIGIFTNLMPFTSLNHYCQNTERQVPDDLLLE